MQIKLVSIGDEVVNGSVINGNASFLSRTLSFAGYAVHSHMAVKDDHIKAALKEALQTSDLVIATGGLGPTLDDKTKQAVKALFKTRFIIDAKWSKELIKRKTPAEFAKEQAQVLQNALVLFNSLGSAPAQILKHGKKALILLPGVPAEMEKLFLDQALPWIKRKYPLKAKVFLETVHLCLLKETDVAKFLKELAAEDKEISIGIYPHFTTLKITLTVQSKDLKAAKRKLLPLKEKIEKAYQSYVFGSKTQLKGPEDINLSAAVRNLFLQKKKTLAVAESCTGGALSAFLCQEKDASKYFLGGLVTYSNLLKTSFLKVKKTTLAKHGAVSKETAGEMLKGVLETTGSDFAIAVTGIAGPSGGSLQKPVGTVFIAIGQKGQEPEIEKVIFPQDRKQVINFSVFFALSRLFVKIKAL